MTRMAESWKTMLTRWAFNFYPVYRATGGRVQYIEENWKEIRIKLPLNWRTRNYVGTIFGGSIYSSVDPMYMLMLIKILGPKYVVWDKAAAIRFKKPGRSTLYAKFLIPYEEVDFIKKKLEIRGSIDRIYNVNLMDGAGEIHASVEKTIYISKKR
jgi:acyl-coenzyme A thioesterase PaaI-like protein